MSNPTHATITVAFDAKTSKVVGLEIILSNDHGVSPNAITEAIRTAFAPLHVTAPHQSGGRLVYRNTDPGSATTELIPRIQ